MRNYVDDNIAALATPLGIGAIAVIRVSGRNIEDVICGLTGNLHFQPRYSTLTDIFSPQTGKLIDKSLVTYFKSPDSYTGEDVFEISCHGGEYIPNEILAAIYNLGVRAAKAGEFSFRAFMNGKIDLLQAESINGLINSKTGSTAAANLDNLSGKLSKKINFLRKSLINMLSIIEHELDFHEDEITFTRREDVINKLSGLADIIRDLASSFSTGRLLSRGIRVPIIGRPNSGKSSLFNAIVGHERAIVSNIPGTTRDTLESWFDLEGFSVCLIDTAGYWESNDFLENLGIKRTMTEIGRANFIIFVDEQDPVGEFENSLTDIDSEAVIFVKTKCDLRSSSPDGGLSETLCTSTNDGSGINELVTKLSTKINTSYKNNNENNLLLLTSRQSALFSLSNSLINNSLDGFRSGGGVDLLASDLREIVGVLDEAIGKIANREVIENIFSNFCVGK